MTIYEEIQEERKRQDQKWGEQNPPSLDPVLLNRPGSCTPGRMAEHYEIPGELRAKFLCGINFERGEGTWAHILVEEVAEVVSCLADEKAMREELVQTAAVVVAWIEYLDRKQHKEEVK